MVGKVSETWEKSQGGEEEGEKEKLRKMQQMRQTQRAWICEDAADKVAAWKRPDSSLGLSIYLFICNKML